jgi:predicted anti-sigma-YlaC factor YlaD
MDDQFEPARLSEWLRSIATTQDEEVDCDAIVEAAERLVAMGARGYDLQAVLPDIALHLDHCSNCREWYETLVALSREDAAP